MIIAKAPLRITLAGGGTDLPDFYSKYGGSVTSMAIDKYIYINFKKNILDKLVRLRYLKTEEVDNANKLSNERAREVLKYYNIYEQCEITSTGELPSSSGLGSSGSYLVALIAALEKFSGHSIDKHKIAELACKIEIDTLKEPVGKQDQFISSYGGIKTFNIDTNGSVTVENFDIPQIDAEEFITRNRIYYTGVQRDASSILKTQKTDKTRFEQNMRKIQELSSLFSSALKEKRYDDYGELLNLHWQQKRSLSSSMSNGEIDRLYQQLLDDKYILGGKIIGAGGGGFLLLYSHKDHQYLDEYMQHLGMPRMEYAIDHHGVKVIEGL